MKSIDSLKTMCEETRSHTQLLTSEISERVEQVEHLLNEIAELSTLAGLGVDLDHLIYRVNNLPNYQGEEWFSSTRC